MITQPFRRGAEYGLIPKRPAVSFPLAIRGRICRPSSAGDCRHDALSDVNQAEGIAVFSSRWMAWRSSAIARNPQTRRISRASRPAVQETQAALGQRRHRDQVLIAEPGYQFGCLAFVGAAVDPDPAV